LKDIRMTRQHYGDYIRRTQSNWHRENGGERQKPRPELVPFEECKKQEEARASPAKEKASKLYTAGDLQWMEFPPLRFIIPGYLVEGLTILVGKPKRGKSWMALDWVLAVAHGGHAFGTIQCDVGDCLYMALEDSPRRMQRRIRQLLPKTP
jgi:hypothetical protein